jgi:DNA-binding NarL/FixJ family response regulator
MDHCIQVLIVDDRRRSRCGLRVLLATYPEVNVVGEAVNGREAVQLVSERQPDVVLMDVRMPIMDGLEATRLIKRKCPDVKVVVLTMYDTHRSEALAAGADSFLLKGCPSGDLLDAIQAADTRDR